MDIEQTTDFSALNLEIMQLKEKNRSLQLELRESKRSYGLLERKSNALENNNSLNINKLRLIASENERQKRFLTHLMRNSVNFLILLDHNLDIVYCSDLFLSKIGVGHIDKIEGKNIIDVYRIFASDDELLNQIKGGVDSSVEMRETFRLDVVADIVGNGECRAYRITHTPIIEQNLCGLIVDWFDTTDITNAIKEAEEANKSKSNFLAMMSHEIRTPINAVIGISQIQLQGENLPKEYMTALEKIYSSGDILLGIVNDILDISKIETGKLMLSPDDYDVPSLLNDMIQLNIVRIGSKPIEFIPEIDANLPLRLYGDELRLKQILNNLLSNAFKYTDKGYVKLSVSHTATNEEVMLRFIIEDSGKGLKPEDVKNVFSEYQRFNTDSNRTIEGTGLGLSIVKKLVVMMDGDIKVQSEYGKGSTFTVTVKQKSIEANAIGPEITKQLCDFTYKSVNKELKITPQLMPYGSVLVVDDVDTNLYIAQGLLSFYKLKIETVTSGFAAIDKVKDGNVYDIIFMDHMMPKMNGMEATQKLRALGYSGAIVALTANALAGNDKFFIQNGFDGFISKPINIDHLNKVLIKYIRDQYPEEAEKFADQSQIVIPSQPIEVTPKLIKVFLMDAVKAVITLRETTENGDLKLFTTTVHAMKSALIGIGENSISEMASALEKAGLGGDMEYISANSKIFIETLENLIKSFAEAETENEENTDLYEDTAFLKEHLLLVAEACEKYDDESAYSALDKLKEKRWNKETSLALEDIRDMLYVLSDFEQAAANARSMCLMIDNV